MFQYFMHLRYDRLIMLQGYNDTSISEVSLTSTKCRTLGCLQNLTNEYELISKFYSEFSLNTMVSSKYDI